MKEEKSDDSKKKYGYFEFKSKTLSYDPNKPRNRPDYMKWMSDEEVKKHLDKKRLNFGVLVVNVLYDNNAGNIIRSANAFGAQEIILYGHRKFDRRASVGAEFYSHFRHIKYVEDLDLIFKDYEIAVAIENTDNAIPLNEFDWQKDKKTLIIVGQEDSGIPEEVLERCDYKVGIVQFGSVRSLNVSVAAGIAMHDYCSKTDALKKYKQ